VCVGAGQTSKSQVSCFVRNPRCREHNTKKKFESLFTHTDQIGSAQYPPTLEATTTTSNEVLTHYQRNFDVITNTDKPTSYTQQTK